MNNQYNIASNISALFKIIGIIVGLFVLSIVVSQIIHLKENYYNLLDSDLKHLYWNIGSSIVGLICSIGLYFRKKWAWIGLSFFFSLEILKNLLISPGFTYVFEYIIAYSMIGIPLIILQLPGIRHSFKFSLLNLIILLCSALFFVLLQKNIKASPVQNISSFYIYHYNDQIYYEDTTFTGGLFEKDKQGNIIFEGSVINGYKSGKWISYSENGLKWREEIFNEGYCEGLYLEWFPNYDKLKLEGKYVAGKKHGIWREYDFDTYYVKISTYKFGEALSHEYINLEEDQ